MSDETLSIMYIIKRPMYRVVIVIDGDDIDVRLSLTPSGRSYARRRARGFHRRPQDDDDLMCEIIEASELWREHKRPDEIKEARMK